MSPDHENNLLVRLLYGEDPGQEPERRDAEFQKHYRRMADVKSRLDRRPPQRPAPEVVDHVVDYAGTRAASSRRNERPPAKRGTKRPFYSLAGAVAASLVVIGLGWWQFTEVGQSPADLAAMSDQAHVESAEAGTQAAQHAPIGDVEATDARSIDAQATDAQATDAHTTDARPTDAQATDAQRSDAQSINAEVADVNATGRSAAGVKATGASAADPRASSPEWNHADDVYEVYRRIEMIRARGQASYQPAAASTNDATPHATSTN